MLTLYYSTGSSSMATHIALYEVGAPFEAKLTELHNHAHRAPEYLSVNPEGKVPTLVIDGRPLTEVAATLWYLARRYPEAGLMPQFGDIEAEARVISWMSFIAATIHPSRRQGDDPGAPPSMPPSSASDRTNGPPAAIRLPTSTCSGCSGGLSTRSARRRATPIRTCRRIMTA